MYTCLKEWYLQLCLQFGDGTSLTPKQTKSSGSQGSIPIFNVLGDFKDPMASYPSSFTISQHISYCMKMQLILAILAFFLSRDVFLFSIYNLQEVTFFCLFQVFVRDNEAQLFLNDKPVVSFTSHLSPIGRGGVIVAAGVNSVIRIRGLDVAAVEPFFFSFYNCKSHQMIRDQFYILSAPFGTFPDSGFCRAISKQRISGTNYIITARMFNENLYPGSKVGLMFNAQDPYNFDFVNFQ